MGIYKNEQRELNQAFNAEGNFDGLNQQISSLEENEKIQKLETQLNKMQTLAENPSNQTTEDERPTRILELSQIQAALQESINNTIDQKANSELEEAQRQLNKAFNQR